MSTRLRRLPSSVETFLATQCRTGADEFGGLLSSRLLEAMEHATIDATYSFVGDDSILGEDIDPSFGGVSSPDSVVQLGRLCSEILRADGDESVLLVEELLIRRSDPEPDLFGQVAAFSGDRLFALLTGTSSTAAIADAFESQYPYPGISVISKSPFTYQPTSRSHELSAAQIELIADSAVLVIAAAWDGEGHILAPLDSRTNAFLARV